MSDWRDSYDAWKLATPPEYDGPEEPEDPPCPVCGCEERSGCGYLLCECPGDPEPPPQHDAHVKDYDAQLF